MIESVITALAPLVGDLIRAATKGTDVAGLVASARHAIATYHEAQAEGRERMLADWEATKARLWP